MSTKPFDIDADPFAGMTASEIADFRMRNEMSLIEMAKRNRRKAKGRPVEGSRKFAVSVTLDQEALDTFLALGNANLSAGVRKAAEIVRGLHADESAG